MFSFQSHELLFHVAATRYSVDFHINGVECLYQSGLNPLTKTFRSRKAALFQDVDIVLQRLLRAIPVEMYCQHGIRLPIAVGLHDLFNTLNVDYPELE